MFNDNEDDAPVETDSDFNAALTDDIVDEQEPAASGPPARRRRAAPKRKAAPKARKAAPPARPAEQKATKARKSSTAKKAAGSSKKKAGDLTGVKAGAHTVWVSKELADALTSKDRRKLKALLKRATKRRQAKT